MKKDVQSNNSNENSTHEKNVADYTDKVISVFYINTQKTKRLHLPRSCLNGSKEKGKLDIQKTIKWAKSKTVIFDI